MYYLILLVLRGAAVLLAGRASLRGDAEETGRVKYLVLAVLLLLLNVSLIVPISLMIRQERPVGMTIIPAIAAAAYTTYKIVMASVNLKKGRASGSGFVRLLRATGFIDALVSVLTLQNTLICAVSGSGSGCAAASDDRGQHRRVGRRHGAGRRRRRRKRQGNAGRKMNRAGYPGRHRHDLWIVPSVVFRRERSVTRPSRSPKTVVFSGGK